MWGKLHNFIHLSKFKQYSKGVKVYVNYMNKFVLKPSIVSGNIAVPSSKSVAHRALIAAAFSDKPIKVKNIDFSKATGYYGTIWEVK